MAYADDNWWSFRSEVNQKRMKKVIFYQEKLGENAVFEN